MNLHEEQKISKVKNNNRGPTHAGAWQILNYESSFAIRNTNE